VQKNRKVKVHFSDYFGVDPDVLQEYGAFDVSLISDLPMFIDPFLLFHSAKEKYQALHERMLDYLRFLRDRSSSGAVSNGLLRTWYCFPEVKQNWMGFSESGNAGSGLGIDFARSLHAALATILSPLGEQRITRGSHLEKVCLIKPGVGRDNISDFTTNLIKEFLLEYTQAFARDHIPSEHIRRCTVDRVRFNYKTEAWQRDVYDLPWVKGDYVLLTPIDMLTREEVWISRRDFVDGIRALPAVIPDEALREQLNNYLSNVLAKDADREAKQRVAQSVIEKYPEVVDYYIKYKEDRGDEAVSLSADFVEDSATIFVDQAKEVVSELGTTPFYSLAGDTCDEALARLHFLKDIIENKDGYRLFYVKGQPIKREKDLQILYRLTWWATPSDVNREVNNGRGPVDFKVSRGASDKTLVEFKLASNSKLRDNLAKQVEVYEKANDTRKSIKAIMYYSESEYMKVVKILNELNLIGKDSVILIDARMDNKPSASNA